MTEFVSALVGAVIGAMISAQYAYHTNRLDNFRILVVDMHKSLDDLFLLLTRFHSDDMSLRDLNEVHATVVRNSMHIVLLIGPDKAMPFSKAIKSLLDAISSASDDYQSSDDEETDRFYEVFKEHSNKPQRELYALYSKIAKTSPFMMDE